jgi:hypothetical protein
VFCRSLRENDKSLCEITKKRNYLSQFGQIVLRFWKLQSKFGKNIVLTKVSYDANLGVQLFLEPNICAGQGT